jgi:hypothetical protein
LIGLELIGLELIGLELIGLELIGPELIGPELIGLNRQIGFGPTSNDLKPVPQDRNSSLSNP